MKILLTNDDGYRAEGLKVLFEALKDEHEVLVCAPQRQRSGTSQCLTLETPLRAHKLPASTGMTGWLVEGTPADCVKLGLSTLLQGESVDWVISGINRGSNTGALVHYSGTVAGAKEAALIGVPSLAVSLCGYHNLDYQASARWARRVVAKLEQQRAQISAEESRARPLFFNMNVPNRSFDSIAGVKVVPVSQRVLRDKYEERVDPRGQKYYWLTADLHFDGPRAQDDLWAVKEGYVALSPMSLDWTEGALIESLKPSLEDES